MKLILPCLCIAISLFAAPAAAEPMQVVVDGRVRTALLERPSAQGPHPTIVLLHGFGDSGASIARRSGLDRLAPQNGYVGVFPDGLRNRWNHFAPGTEPQIVVDGYRRDLGGMPDDVAFIKRIIADLVRNGISDPARVYLAGLSNGGFMTLRMMCADAGVFAAAALLVSGMVDELGARCRPAKPLPVLMINGTADTTVRYNGGLVDDVFKLWPTERLVGFLREVNGCGGAAEQSLLEASRSRTELARWTRCTGAPIAFYRVVGGDHGAAWTLNFGSLLLDFFREQPRDGAVIAAASTQPAPGAARPASVKALFEKYDLLGTFAWKCDQPVSRDNRYYVHRVLDAQRVQRDMMSSLNTRDFSVVFDRAAELRPNEILVGGLRDGQPVESVYRVEPNRVRVLESTVGGQQEISGGRFVSGAEAPWMNKCSAR